MRNNKKLLFLAIIILIIVITGLDFVACKIYCRTVNAYFQQHEIKESDVTVVFFGDYSKNLGLGTETLKRLKHTFDLFICGKTENIVCVGGSGLVKICGVSGAQLMHDYLVKNGVPEENVLFDTASYDSYTNWEEARRIISSHEWSSITLVSSSLHLYRLAKFVRDDTLDISFSPYSDECLESFKNFFYTRRWIHHEWIAITARKIFPDPYYRKLLIAIRNTQVKLSRSKKTNEK